MWQNASDDLQTVLCFLNMERNYIVSQNMLLYQFEPRYKKVVFKDKCCGKHNLNSLFNIANVFTDLRYYRL